MNYTIGEKIATLRKEKHITQTELAEYLYLTPQTVSRWEVGNGIPESSVLPKIAAFFGISIDELFGLTSMSRAEDLVLKYSVLRDDHTFREAMDCLNSQIQTVDAAVANEMKDALELQKDKDQLQALKVHLLLQQGRESFEKALKIVDSFVEKTEDDPNEPWYLPMRLQRLQLCAALEKGRAELEACERNFTADPNVITLEIYFEMLLILQNYEMIISIQESNVHAQKILFPPSKENLVLWKQLIRAAVGMENLNFVDKYMGTAMEQGTKQDRFDLLRMVIRLYKEKNLEERLESTKRELITMLPDLSYDDYFTDQIKKEIEQKG